MQSFKYKWCHLIPNDTLLARSNESFFNLFLNLLSSNWVWIRNCDHNPIREPKTLLLKNKPCCILGILYISRYFWSRLRTKKCRKFISLIANNGHSLSLQILQRLRYIQNRFSPGADYRRRSSSKLRQISTNIKWTLSSSMNASYPSCSK